MLVHEFIAVPSCDIPLEITYAFKMKHDSVSVDDDIVLNNPHDFLETFTAHWDYIGNIQSGLNYHGITIIATQDLEQFFRGLIKQKEKKCVTDLIDLCHFALKQNWDIVHFGI